MSKLRLTNAQFIRRLMDENPLQNVAITSIVNEYCENIAKQPRPTEHGEGMISNVAWWDVCKKINEAFKSR
jgi:hypothetical protein